MFGIIIAGLLSAPYIKQSVWPDFAINYVSATVVYPGAAPEDVELNVTNKIEDALKGVSGIARIRSVSFENRSEIEVFLDPDARDLGFTEADRVEYQKKTVIDFSGCPGSDPTRS